ncbi:MAG: glycosyltransferase family 4 protein [Candidatus Limnocylindria bacterium]
MSRVAIVAHAAFPADPRLRRQTDALIGSGHEVDLFCLRAPGELAEEDLRGVRVIRLPVHRAFAGFAGHMAEYLAFGGIAAVRLAREHARRHYRLVQVATLPDFLAFAAAPLKLSGVPLLLDLHEDMPEFFRDRFAQRALQPLLPLVTGAAKASAWVADKLITVHEPLRELSIARGVPPDKIAVVMNSADTDLFDPARHPRRPFMEDGELRLIHHSNLQRIYGQEVLIEAVARIGAELPVRADIYGDGPYRSQLEAAVSRTGTADRVHLNGPVPIDQLPQLIAAADIGVIPSLPEPYMQYSLSTKLLEYAAMGVPIVASDLRTIRAHFTADAICYVPGGDPDALARAFRSLAADPVEATRLGAEARRQEAPYEWAAQAQRYVAIVERLAGR